MEAQSMSVDRRLLEGHVRESNAIENIFVGQKHHFFADHLAAAQFVGRSVEEGLNVAARPDEIHRILMGREMADAGKFRLVWVRVGQHLKPPPEIVEALLEQWRESLAKNIGRKYLALHRREELAWRYHHWFEVIHPFRDGNGRTGRLILNGIRLRLGLSWLIVPLSGREDYYKSIREWEIRYGALLGSDSELSLI